MYVEASGETTRRSAEPVWRDDGAQGAAGQVKFTVLASSPALSCSLSPGLGDINEPIQLYREHPPFWL
ncbi:unnamed protein product [Leptosia nina]|uniref:Uncharacterized protein n=1 Tax=Leptosia nina TaxID=320188 RepID=A0AAV1JU22_9NEOP